jgi:hypothetical protein
MLSFNDPLPLDRETGTFRLHLADGIATFEMLTTFAAEEAARAVVDSYCRAWELDFALRMGRDITFVFEAAEVETPRRFPGAHGQVVQVSAIDATGRVFDVASVSVGYAVYPEPPERFANSVETDMMYYHLRQYRGRRESLATMGYFCLSVLEWGAGGRTGAAKRYSVDPRVLDALGRLTSTVGDPQTARKLDRHSTLRPHAPGEIAWVEAAVVALIRRAGEVAYDAAAARPELTLADLPPLTARHITA